MRGWSVVGGDSAMTDIILLIAIFVSWFICLGGLVWQIAVVWTHNLNHEWAKAKASDRRTNYWFIVIAVLFCLSIAYVFYFGKLK